MTINKLLKDTINDPNIIVSTTLIMHTITFNFQNGITKTFPLDPKNAIDSLLLKSNQTNVPINLAVEYLKSIIEKLDYIRLVKAIRGKIDRVNYITDSVPYPILEIVYSLKAFNKVNYYYRNTVFTQNALFHLTYNEKWLIDIAAVRPLVKKDGEDFINRLLENLYIDTLHL
ncbi:hypothetical protein QNI16_10480 [Cytophagaceae bacterium YF14B1]|uniref:Uncharacterized protein n=1 Tax=Xanthocytophaga flava TaxID=3048013 RepID=A0AAE3QQJ3_9BACT|nr:hypothetical protein [Xanthocytophaga flavus]MDJ1480908.1 hypothetical protein [Xanthocytophaga flavus]